ncbi:isocitrate lyase/phosphoenolpyruvate mutase family protein, partial [Streptomyces hydrogenans]
TLTARLEAVRASAERAGADLFVNARVDTYLLALGDPATRLRDTLERARSYVDAGADGIFVPGVTDPGLIATLAEALTVPLNVLAAPGTPSVKELGALGVARVSLGSGIAQAAYAVARRAARELYGAGTYDSLRQDLDYTHLNDLLGSSG